MNKYGLKECEWEETLRILSANKKIEKAILFGSRAMNTFKPMSDVDIVIYGDSLQYSDSSSLIGNFEDSDLPYMFDIVNYNTIKSKDLLEHIEKFGVRIYLKGWVETTLGEVVELTQGVAINKKTDFVLCDKSKGVPLLKINNLLNNTVDQYVDLDLVPQKTILKKDDVIFTRTGQVGWVFTDKSGVLHNNSFKVIPNKKLNKKFLYWFLKQKNIYDYVQKVASGSAQPDLNHDAFKTIEIGLPSNIEEQKAIANILTALDDKIENLQAQNKTLEQTAQTIFRQWFGKYQIGDELPEGWRVGKLEEEFDISIGRTPPRKETQWFSKKTIGKKWISIKDIGNCGVYIENTLESLTNEAIDKFNIPVIPENTTVLSFKMTVGKLTITTEEMLSNEAIAHLKIKEDSFLTSEYIYLYLQNLDFNSLGSTSSIVTAINSTIIRNLDFIIPERATLAKFHNISISIFQKIKNNAQQIRTLKKTRDTLLPKLMNGEVKIIIDD